MVQRGAVDAELASETSEECSNFGEVVDCSVHEVPNAPPHLSVRIFVAFRDQQSATKGQQ